MASAVYADDPRVVRRAGAPQAGSWPLMGIVGVGGAQGNLTLSWEPRADLGARVGANLSSGRHSPAG